MSQREKKQQEAKPKTTSRFSSSAVKAYSAIFLCFVVGLGYLAWNIRSNVEEGYRHRLRELRKASERLEKSFQTNLGNVANIYHSKSTEEIANLDQWISEIADQQPFLSYRKVAKPTTRISVDGSELVLNSERSNYQKPDESTPDLSADRRELRLHSETFEVRVVPELLISNSKSVSIPIQFWLPPENVNGPKTQDLCWVSMDADADSADCLEDGAVLKPAKLGQSFGAGQLGVKQHWKKLLPLPGGLSPKEATKENLMIRDGYLGFLVEQKNGELDAASVLLATELHDLLVEREPEGLNYGFTLGSDRVFECGKPWPDDLRLWVELPATEAQLSAIGQYLLVVSDREGDQRYPITVEPEMRSEEKLSEPRLDRSFFKGNWKLKTKHGEIDIDNQLGAKIDKYHQRGSGGLRIKFCDEQKPCFSNDQQQRLAAKAGSTGWISDTDRTKLVEGRKIRMEFKATSRASAAGSLFEGARLVGPRILEVSEAKVFRQLDVEQGHPLASLDAEMLEELRDAGGNPSFELKSVAGRDLELRYEHVVPLEKSALSCSQGEQLQQAVLEWSTTATVNQDSKVSIELECSGDRWAQFSMDLRKMLENAAWVDEFDQWAIFDDQKGRDLLSYDRHPGPFRIDTQAVFDSIQTQKQKKSENGADHASEHRLLGAFERDVEVSGAAIKVYCQVVAVPESVQLPKLYQGRNSWYLCGLVDSARVRREAISLDPSRTAGAILLALFLVGVIAYAKLGLMVPQERLRRFDLVVLASSTLLLLAVMAVANMAFYRGWVARADLDSQLVDLAAEVKHKLLGDLSSYRDELKNLDYRRCREGPPKECPGGWVDDEKAAEAEGEDDQEIPRETSIFGAAEKSAPECRLGASLRQETPLFSSVFWLDDRGWQVHKMTARARNTPKVQLNKRAYFSEIRKGNGLDAACFHPQGCGAQRKKVDAPAVAGNNEEDTRIFFETNISVTTGDPFFAISQKSSCAEADSALSRKVKVAVLTGKLAPMDSLVTPPFHFAVVDAAGQVVLSSHPRLQIRDLITAEARRPERLGKALRLGLPISMDLELWNREYRAHVRPLLPAEAWRGAVPLRVVTVYQRELVRTMIAEAVLLATVLLLVYLVGAVLFTAWFRSQLHQLFWPESTTGRGSFWEAALLVGLGVAAAILWGLNDTALMKNLGLMLILGALAVLLYISRLKSDRRLRESDDSVDEAPRPNPLRYFPWLRKDDQSSADPRARLSLELVVILLGLVLGVVPGVGLFEWAWQFQVLSHGHHQSAWLEQAEEARKLRLNDEWKGKIPDKRLTARIARRSDRYFLPALTGSEPAGSAAEYPDPPERDSSFSPVVEAGSSSGFSLKHSLLGLLSDGLPIYNETSGQNRFRGRANGMDSVPLLVLVVMLLITPILSLSVVLWMFSVRRNMELRIDPNQPTDTLERLIDSVHDFDQQKLVILTSADQWKKIRSVPGVQTLDLTHVSKDSDGTNRPLFVFGLSQALAEPSLRESTLERLSGLINDPSNRSLWIFTSSDPYRLLEEAVAEGVGRREAGAILDFGDAARWVHLLGRLERVYVPVDTECLRKTSKDKVDDVFWPILWGCADPERLTLLHLASEGVVNPKQKSAVQSLVCRGILHTDHPDRPISFFSERFRQFVLDHADTGHLLAWEQEEAKKGWGSRKIIFATLLAILFSFLFFLDNELLESLVGLLTGLAAIIPLGLSLVARFNQSS